MNVKAKAKPAIVINETDAERLSMLANRMSSRMPEVAEALLSEIDRASVVADDRIPEDAVRMGSIVTYEAGGVVRQVTLVFPGEADIEQGKVSVMTPIGAALLGMRPGKAISYAARDGREHVLTVVEVRQPQPAPALT